MGAHQRTHLVRLIPEASVPMEILVPNALWGGASPMHYVVHYEEDHNSHPGISQPSQVKKVWNHHKTVLPIPKLCQPFQKDTMVNGIKSRWKVWKDQQGCTHSLTPALGTGYPPKQQSLTPSRSPASSQTEKNTDNAWDNSRHGKCRV